MKLPWLPGVVSRDTVEPALWWEQAGGCEGSSACAFPEELQLFGILELSCIHCTVHLSLTSLGDPGASEAGNVFVFIHDFY